MSSLIKGMGQAKQITTQATTEMESQWEHFFGTLEGGHAQAAQATEQATESIQTNWLAVAAVYGAVAAAGTMLIKNIVGVAMRTQELGIVSEITAKNMGIAKEVVNGQIEALKNLGLTTQAASTLTTQFMRSELELADASKLARAAQNLAIVAMMDSSQAAMTMTRAITMQRPILLRQFGIIGGLNNAYDAMGKTLGILSFRVDSSGKTLRVWSRELTVAEKRQSIFNMIMEQSAGLAGAYEAAMDAPGKALRSFGRHIMSAQEAIGKFWLPAMDAAVKVATKFIKAFVNAPEIVHQLAGALLVGVTAVSAMTAAIILKTMAAKSMIFTMLAAKVSVLGFTTSLAAATLGLSLIIAAIVMLVIKINEHNKAMQTARQETFAASDTYAEYTRKMEAAGASAHALSEEMWELAKAERDAAEAQRILLESADYETYAKAMRDAGLGALALAEGIWEAEKAQAALTGTTSKSISEIEKEAQARERLLESLRNHQSELGGLLAARRAGIKFSKEYYDARKKELEQLVLWDVGLRKVALAEGLVTQAQVDAVRARESIAQSMQLSAQKRLEMATAADTYMQANIARAIERQKLVQEAYQESLEVITKSLKDIGKTVGEGYVKMAALAEGYQNTVIQLDTELAEQRIKIAQQSTVALGQIEASRYISMQQYSGQALLLLKASYESQVAAVKAATQEQLALVEKVNTERLLVANKAYHQELVNLKKFIGDKLLMWAQLHAAELKGIGVYDEILAAVKKSFDGQLTIADQFTVKYQELMTAMADGNLGVISRIIIDIRKLGREIDAEMSSAAENIVSTQKAIGETIETGWAEIHTFVASALSSLAGLTQDYQNKVLEAWDSYNTSVVNAAFERNKSLREGEINYQRSRQEITAKANAEIVAMQAASLAAENAEQKAKLDEKITNRQAKLDEELTMLEYNYETQKAWAKWNWDIQQLMQEQAHHLRLAETAEFAMKEAKILQALAQAKLNGMLASLHAAAGYAHKMLLIEGIIVKSAVASARSQIEAIQAVIAAHKKAADSFEADLSEQLAIVDRIGGEIQDLIAVGPQLPELPDFSQWVGDFSEGMAKSGASMKKSAKETAVSVTKTLKEAIIDIAEGFSAAMEIFNQVAEYETPTGLAEGMKMLRQDIEEAVRQMYIAYQAIGEDGVKGAKLIAEASKSVIETLGVAVKVFTEGVANYEGIIPEAIDALLGDIKYVLIAVRTKLLDLWGWSGERKDTVWGHMESWSAAVGSVVELIGQAVLTFSLLKDYTGIMPGIINVLVDDIKQVLDVIDDVFDDFADEEPDQLKTAWLQFASTLIGLVGGMIEDLKTIAAFEGGIRIGTMSLINLLEAVKNSIAIITGFFRAQPWLFDEATTEASATAMAWFDLNGTLISLIVDMIEDIQTIAAFEGGLRVNTMALVGLLENIKNAVAIIAGFFMAQPYLFDKATASIVALATTWLRLNSELIAFVAGIIDDLEKLGTFQGDVDLSGLQGLIILMKKTADIILINLKDAVPDISEGSLNDLKQRWLDFTAAIIEVVASIIDDLNTIGDFQGDIDLSNVKRLTTLMEKAANQILVALQETIPDTSEGSLNDIKRKWLEFTSGLIALVAGVIEDMEKIAAFEGGIKISTANIQNLVSALDSVVSLILAALDEVTDDFQDEDSIDQFKAAWLEFSAELISAVAGVIEDLRTITAYEGDIQVGFDEVQQLVWQIDVTTRNILDAIGTVGETFTWATKEADELKAGWLEFSTGLIAALAGVVADLGIVARFKGGIVAVQSDVENLINVLKNVVDWLLTAIGDVSDQFDEQGKYVDELKIAWVKVQAGLIKAMSDIAEGIEDIASFKAVDEAKFKVALDAMFDALYWFLEEFSLRADLFSGVVSETGAEIAKLIGESVKGLGDAIEPLIDIVTFSISPAEAETAIGQFFDALEVFLDILDEHVDDFADEADQDTADLAAAIGEIVSGIGAAVDPLIKIIEYNPKVKDLEATFEEFFGHLNRVLWWIEFEKTNWEVSDAAIELAAKIEEVMGYLKTAVDFLDEMATYGEDTTVSALTGFLAFLIDLERIVEAINDAGDVISEEALASAAQFATDCNQVLTDIKAGMGKLNSLQYLSTEESNLVEAGKALIISLIDGLVEQVRDEWLRAISAIAALITQVLRMIDAALPLLDAAGVGLGESLIQGMIEGLQSESSALYLIIANIVKMAIIAAEQAAGIASRSQVMFDFGNQMTRGLIEGLQTQQGDVLSALTGMLAVPEIVLSPQLAGIGGGDTYQYTYQEAAGRGPRERSVRQDFEAMEIYQRMRS